MARLNRLTRQLVEVIEEGLDNGVGDLNPTLDDIRIRFSAVTGLTLDESKVAMENRLDTALTVLRDRGWAWCKVLRYFVETYKGQPDDHPHRSEEIIRCVAGAGMPHRTFAIHFHVPHRNDEDPNCEMWMQARVQNLDSADAKRSINIEQVSDAAIAGQVDLLGVKKIVGKQSLDRDTKRRLEEIVEGMTDA